MGAAGSSRIRSQLPCWTSSRDDLRRNLAELRRNFLQNLNKPLAIPFADDPVEIALVPPRAARQHGEHPFSGRREIEPIGAPVAVHAFALDQPALHQIPDPGRKAGLVAPVGQRQLRLADAGIARDQCQSGEPAWAFADLLRKVGESLESSLLRHTEVEADPVREWTKIDR